MEAGRGSSDSITITHLKAQGPSRTCNESKEEEEEEEEEEEDTARRGSMGGRRPREHSGSSRREGAVGTVRLRSASVGTVRLMASMALPILCLLSMGGADAAFTASSLAFAPAQVGAPETLVVHRVDSARRDKCRERDVFFFFITLKPRVE